MIHTIFAFFYVFLSAVVLTPIALVIHIICLFGLWRYRANFIYGVARLWALLMIKISACDMTVTGRENIPPQGGICFVSNHGSIFDAALMLAYLGRPFGFIAKKELIYIPLINLWIPMMGGFYIDRKNLRKGLKTINQGISRIKAGGAMIIFPEGRRSRGNGLLPFRSGALKLATQAGAPIIPIAIKGSYEVFEKNSRLCPGPVMVSFGKPIHTADLSVENRKQQLADRVYQVIDEALKAGAP